MYQGVLRLNSQGKSLVDVAVGGELVVLLKGMCDRALEFLKDDLKY